MSYTVTALNRDSSRLLSAPVLNKIEYGRGKEIESIVLLVAVEESLSFWQWLLMYQHHTFYKVLLQQKDADFILYSSHEEGEARIAFDAINSILSPLIDDGYVLFTPDLLKELILPAPRQREKLAIEIIDIMSKSSEIHPNWALVLRSLLEYFSKKNEKANIQTLMHKGANPKTLSGDGRNSLHNLAHTGSGTSMAAILSSMTPDDIQEAVNVKDSNGHTPLTVAMKKSNRSAIKELIKAGARAEDDVATAAMDNYQSFIQSVVEVGLEGESKFAQVKDLLNIFHNGLTPLMIAVKNQNVESVIQLLLGGADPNLVQPETGNTSLHIAAECGNEYIVKALVVYEARLSTLNKKGETAIDIANHNGHKQVSSILNEVLNMQKKAVVEPKGNKVELDSDSLVLLSLDGGGVRGLVLGHLLGAIEKRMKLIDANCKPLQDYFDYIAGTSVGGIGALFMAYKGSLPCANAMLLSAADTIFDSDISERERMVDNLHRSAFGSDTKMTAKVRPRVIVTASLVTSIPGTLHLFTNFGDATNGQLHPSSQDVYEAAKATSAAPYYFPPVKGRFIDGGIMASNPTLPAMVRIMEETKKEGKQAKLGCVISLGTGKPPVEELEEAVDIHFSSYADMLFNFGDVISNLKNLFSIIVKRVSESDGLPVQIAREWCESINCHYYRITPPLSKNVNLSSTDRKAIINMLYDTYLYTLENINEIDTVAHLLLSLSMK